MHQIHTGHAQYLAHSVQLIVESSCRPGLRSADNDTADYIKRHTRTKLGERCFNHAGPPFKYLAVPASHLLLPFPAHQPYAHWKSEIPHLDMHHLVSGINSKIHFISLVSPVLIHLLIHLSTHPCHHLHSQHPSLLHSFTPGSKPTSSTNPSHLNFTSLLIEPPSL